MLCPPRIDQIYEGVQTDRKVIGNRYLQFFI